MTAAAKSVGTDSLPAAVVVVVAAVAVVADVAPVVAAVAPVVAAVENQY